MTFDHQAHHRHLHAHLERFAPHQPLRDLRWPHGRIPRAFAELGPAMRILWLLPITREEAAFARTHGVEALEQCFEREKLDDDDPRRTTVRLST